VVPSDTLAAHLVRRLPSATRLALALRSSGGLSGGTVRTLLESLASARPSLAHLRRRTGDGQPRTRTFQLGGRARTAVALPSADVLSIRRSTGVEDAAYYLAAPREMRWGLALLATIAPLAPALRVPAVREAAVRAMTGGKPGPTAGERERAWVDLVGEAEDAAGRRAVSRLRVPEAYTLTALAAVELAERLLRAPPAPGFHTPSSAFGPDVLLGLPGVVREDEA
jgi:short subunit dehydrogenase-like uncharacterized protein